MNILIVSVLMFSIRVGDNQNYSVKNKKRASTLDNLKNNNYKSIITSNCKTADTAFHPMYYGKSSFDNFWTSITNNKLTFKSQEYFVLRTNFYDKYRARDIAAKTILSDSSVRSSLIFPKECIYQGDQVIFIYKEVQGLDVTLSQLQEKFKDFEKKVKFAINLLNVYEKLNKEDCIHDNTLLDAIVVDPKNIEEVYLRKFYFSKYKKLNIETPLVKNIGLCNLEWYQLSRGNWKPYEPKRVIWLLIIIQDFLFPIKDWGKPYEVYNTLRNNEKISHHEGRALETLSDTGAKSLDSTIEDWCRGIDFKAQELSNETRYSKVLCKFRNEKGFHGYNEHLFVYYNKIVDELQKLIVTSAIVPG